MNVKYQKSTLHKETSKDIAKSAQKICLSLAIAILADVFDFSDSEIHEFTERYIDLANSLKFGTDSVEGIKKAIKEQYDIDI